MADTIAVRCVRLTYTHGLHMRPASLLSTEAQRFPCDIRISCGDRQADAKSIWSLFSLMAECGSELLIEAHGLKSQLAVERLHRLVTQDFRVSEEFNHALNDI